MNSGVLNDLDEDDADDGSANDFLAATLRFFKKGRCCGLYVLAMKSIMTQSDRHSKGMHQQ
jgi:hypothetical protein